MGEPPDRDPLDQYIGGQAAELLAVYQTARRQRVKTTVQMEALDLLRHLKPPESLVVLFDAMLGGVTSRALDMEPPIPWLEKAAEFEARALQDGKRVSNRMIADYLFDNGLAGKADWEWTERKVKDVRNVKAPYSDLRPEQRAYRWHVRNHQHRIINGEEN